MAKKSLYEIVRDTLNIIGGDYVDSIDGSEESEAIAVLARNIYEELLTTSEWDFMRLTTQLVSLSDSEYPTYLRIPTSLTDVQNIRFQHTTSTGKVQRPELYYLSPNDFLEKLYSRDETKEENSVVYEKVSLVPLVIQTNKPPEYWTSFDDEFIVCDSYDEAVWDTLRGEDTIALGTKASTFVLADSYVPELPDNLFPLFEAELREAANNYIRQQPMPYDSKITKRGINRQRHFAGKLDGRNKQSNYTKQAPVSYARRTR
jgi:hypothetical protein